MIQRSAERRVWSIESVTQRSAERLVGLFDRELKARLKLGKARISLFVSFWIEGEEDARSKGFDRVEYIAGRRESGLRGCRDGADERE